MTFVGSKHDRSVAIFIENRNGSPQHSLLLRGEKEDVDVGEDTTGSDGGAAEESVELFVVANS